MLRPAAGQRQQGPGARWCYQSAQTSTSGVMANARVVYQSRSCASRARDTCGVWGEADGARPAAMGSARSGADWLREARAANSVVAAPWAGGAVRGAPTCSMPAGGIGGGGSKGAAPAGSTNGPDWSSSEELCWGDVSIGANRSGPSERSIQSGERGVASGTSLLAVISITLRSLG